MQTLRVERQVCVQRQAWWLVLHDMDDTGAWPLAARLQGAAPVGVQVHALPPQALIGRVRWDLRVDSSLSADRFTQSSLSIAGLGVHSDALGGVVNRTVMPVHLPEAATDAAYKSAELNALLLAWLHGLHCPVLNRPQPHNVQAAARSAAQWCQAAARHGLPIWAVFSQGTTHAHGAWVDRQRAHAVNIPGLLVIGDAVFEVQSHDAPRWHPALHHAAACATAAAGCDVLMWCGQRDARGVWRIGGASTMADMQAFGPTAVEALAGRFTASCAR